MKKLIIGLAAVLALISTASKAIPAKTADKDDVNKIVLKLQQDDLKPSDSKVIKDTCRQLPVADAEQIWNVALPSVERNWRAGDPVKTKVASVAAAECSIVGRAKTE